MTTQQMAMKLVELCREGKYQQVYDELFSPEIESKEPRQNDQWEVSKGFDGLAAKAKLWESMTEEMVMGEISDPVVAGDFFSCSMKSKVRFKGSPDLIDMDEICVYQVKEGKIILEQFFYPATQ